MKKLSFKSRRRKEHIRSAACRLRDGEAVFQHLKTDDCAISDGEHDREVRLDDLAGSLELGRERTEDHCSIVAGQNVVDLEADPFNHGARVSDEVGDGGPAGPFPNPRQNTAVAWDVPLHIFAEQLVDLGRFSTAAHAAQKFLRKPKSIVLIHGYFLILGGWGCVGMIVLSVC